MLDAHTIQTINCEQLVTATDRMLLGGPGAKRRRPAQPLTFPRDLYASLERTEVDRRPFGSRRATRHGSRAGLRTSAVAVALAIPSLFGVGFGLAALL
jgi:hypothetical protein